MLRLAFALPWAVIVAGCGQKGPLYHPPEPDVEPGEERGDEKGEEKEDDKTSVAPPAPARASHSAPRRSLPFAIPVRFSVRPDASIEHLYGFAAIPTKPEIARDIPPIGCPGDWDCREIALRNSFSGR